MRIRGLLPAGFADTRDHAFVGKFTEANTAETEISHEATTTATLKTAILCTGRELGNARCAILC